MTPARSNTGSSKRFQNSSTVFKPYTRGTAPIVFSSPDSKQSAGTNAQAGTLGSSSPNVNAQKVPAERPGFPTYTQYKQVEAAYIKSLTPRRQGKALISQGMFDRIWDVLHEPDSLGETAQFRFWARKMFTLSKTHRSTLNPFDDDPPEEVLLHDNLLVAVQEQLYDLLCYCHGSTGHGGRDKTCGLIRKHYTWVPKDLVSGFIKACPTCILKKCGNFESVQASPRLEQRIDDATAFRIIGYGPSTDDAAFGTVPPRSLSVSPTPASHGDSVSREMEEVDPIETAYREAVQRGRSMKASLSRMAVARSHLPQSPAMSREVSLYKGLPNGWQYRHSDYASARAEFMKTKELGLDQDSAPGVRMKRPRVPSILPLWVPDHIMQEEYSDHDTDLSNTASQQQDSGLQGDSSLQHLLLGHPRPSLADFKEPQPFEQEIDPLLLQLSDSQSATSTEALNGSYRGVNTRNTNLNVSMSLKRAAAPPRLEIDFSTYRNGLREADVTPDSPLAGINWEHAVHPSPTRSDSSVSMFAVPALMSATPSVSPASSTLRTPVDEFPNGTKDGDHIGVKGNAKVEPVEIELSDGIQQVCGL